jgi:hypothetical protein
LGVLRDYPVREILAVYQTHALKEPIIVEPELYHTVPECGELEDIPFSLSVSPALGLGDFFVNRGSTEPHAMPHYSPTRSMFRVPYRAWLVRDLSGLKVHYRAGYSPGKIPADLASACLELAAWNMSRYRGRRIGVTGNVRGNGKDGEHLEVSMPENVRQLLEPYKRRTI